MDNILEYIVFIFFLISILNGIFGKKKKQQEQKRKAAAQSDELQQKPVPTQRKKKDTQEILEELFGLKIPEQKPETANPKVQQFKLQGEKKQYIEEESSWDPEEEFGTVFKKTKERPKYEPKVYKMPEKFVSTEGNIRASEKYHSFDEPKLVRENSRKREIKAMFKDPKTIRDYIIVQELLNEPKAFRI